jgi:Dyp-type peroxidase family
VPLDLTTNMGPLSLADADLRDVFDDLQGNILNGHGRDQAVLLFLQFVADRLGDVKAVLADLGRDWVTSASAQLAASEAAKTSGEDGGIFVHVALSGAGYAALGVDPKDLPSPADVFNAGMKNRRAELQDPPVDLWEKGFRDEIHALILIADDNNVELINAERALRGMFGGATEPIARVVSTQRGFGLRRLFPTDAGPLGQNVEHFGYVDGRSQPALLDTQLAQDQQLDGIQVWDPTAPPRLVLVADPGGTTGVSFGSFMVFRKLQQNVKGFMTAERQLADELGLPHKLIGAMAVGRFEDGTPVLLQPGDNAQPAAPNDFDYSSDAAGLRCPFQAHIRKTNPRLESVRADGNFAKTEEEERGHRIARRGIPYGGGISDFTDLEGLPERGVGLLFMCYQSDLQNQFEFMQRFWCNNDEFLRPGLPGTDDEASHYALNTGLDAIIGQQEGDVLDPVINKFGAPATTWPSEWGQPTRLTRSSIARFVMMLGGEYFFSPSLTFLRNLSDCEPRTALPSAQSERHLAFTSTEAESRPRPLRKRRPN